VGDSGTVLRYNGVTWKILTAPWKSIVYALFGGPGAGSVTGVGEGGRIFESN
jgi:hypothetical protein